MVQPRTLGGGGSGHRVAFTLGRNLQGTATRAKKKDKNSNILDTVWLGFRIYLQ